MRSSATLSVVLRPALMTALALVVLVGGAELALRLWPATPPVARPDRPTHRPGLKRLRGLPDLVRKNQRGIFSGHLYETNSHGIRDREYDIPKPNDVFRIVATGGSNAMGSGIAEESTYAARIEKGLADHRAPRIEVVNVAIAGANIEHSVNRLAAVGIPYEPDLIVYGFATTDIRLRDRYRSSVTKEMRPKPIRSSIALSRAVQEGLQELQQIRRLPGTYPGEIFDNYFENEAAWQGYLEHLDRLAALGRENGACVLVLLQTQMDSLHGLHPYRDMYDRVAEAAEERGLAVARSFDLFRGEEPESLWVSRGNRHANERSHEILTQALRRGLAALPAACWKTATPNL